MAKQRHSHGLLVLAVAATGALLLTASATFAGFLGNGFGEEENGGFEEQNFDEARRFTEDKSNETRHMKDRARECKDMGRQVKQVKKQLPQEAGEITDLVNGFCNAVGISTKCVQTARNIDGLETCKETIQESINDAASDIWDRLNANNDKLNVLRGIKEEKGTCRNLSRQIRDITRRGKREKLNPERLAQFQSTWGGFPQECSENYARLQELAKQGAYEDAVDLLEEYFRGRNLWEDLKDAENALFVCTGLNNIVHEASKGVKEGKGIISDMKRKKKNTAVLQQLYGKAISSLGEAKAVVDSGECSESDAEDFGQLLQDIGDEFDEELKRLEGRGVRDDEEERAGDEEGDEDLGEDIEGESDGETEFEFEEE